ncbi:hypothetical protein COX24_03820 [bacterium (Candidatus Gribaldobacteria) CG23_combo_of_CG06-09_8_20_14_all_37_87_8]|uniref:LTD domain-containing protein n=2 Tax=Candidatus Gribaldobacteria TaxID=2798536 RepID=A0A2G9ZDY8_9BACT|nr:MAG: hypothetical protein AUJ25_01815 [Parcubacteria group bacterium CG1_02_37_13]PIP31403.1 MAG: hypothetical protein COX24_03820 [bacterium (Candidatus Gribaldobacteria) CG23_combo_of_CG06-09_8_20_14_all_37_87_8]PIR89959.1 MAG: hypothetical protein COU05_03595 [bacterium (Candidatus Gribaldobacteria) CG10_big_fil_rev_8_21_14_0_10_37_21]
MKENKIALGFAFFLCLFIFFPFDCFSEQFLGIIITEVLPNPEGKDSENEFIELFNQEETPLDLTGWQICDKIGQSKTFTFESKIVAPKSFILLFIKETKISLNNEGDGLWLLDKQGNLIDEVTFSETKEGLSYSRNQGNEWLWVPPTPNKPNLFPKTSPEKENSLLKENKGGSVAKEGGEDRVLGSNLALFSLALLVALGSGLVVFFLKRS